MTTLSKLQTVIKKTSPHGKVAQKITGEPCFFTSPTFQASLDSFKGYFVIIITVFKTDVKREKKKPKLIKLS
ncbi:MULTISPECIES: hypothetical protein [Streptococcus]|uniref:hypothetical protein n=1 Tax=Streptococcus TaxID=1301 RepID=UPI0012BC30AF|nr:hypothetical protein [Streptococcus salivarius]MTQ58853.1 hypothetical protein [Streptococcus salivarius]MTQ70826.1 hypothetical protein [Streptococcus salivarius]MTR16312.1 hypothetical protein [Streptococcus salivarius]